MRTIYKNLKALSAILTLGIVAVIQTEPVYAQLKVGDNPSAINAGSVLEIESNTKGLLLPRISLTNTTTWGLAGSPVAGMEVYNTNPSVSQGGVFPPAPGGKGVYYWDGDGWVPSKTPASGGGAGDFDWLKSSNNGSPSDPTDIASNIYHGGNGNQEVMLRTNESGADKYAKFTVRAAHESPTPIVGSFFASTTGFGVSGGVVGIQAESIHPFQIRTSQGFPMIHLKPGGGIGLNTPFLSDDHAITLGGRLIQTESSVPSEASASIAMENAELRLYHANDLAGNPAVGFRHDYYGDDAAKIYHVQPEGTQGYLQIGIRSGNFFKYALTLLNENGFLGVDKTNPAYILDVTGDINASGEVRNSGVILTSDKRLKRNIQPFQDGLAIVSKLNPVSYEKKATIQDTDYNKSEIGFIAQEVQKILPELVREGKDADKTLALDYNSLIPILTKAIQEQQKLIDAQSATIADQVGKIDAQSARLAKIESIIAQQLNAGTSTSK